MHPVAPAARFREIDAFRGIAALWVVLFHYGWRFTTPPFPGHSPVGWGLDVERWIAGNLPDFGLLPVFWFFMISGFVIIWTLERSATWRDFVLSRAARLFPVYWAAVTLSFATGLLAVDAWDDVSLRQFLVNLTMLQEIVGVRMVDGAYWSLTVELLFYVGMLALFALGWLKHLRLVCLVWVLGCIATSVLPLIGFEMPWRVQTYLLLRYGHFLIAGMMFYQLWRGQTGATPFALLALCVVSIACAYSAGDALICCGFLVLFGLAISGRLGFLATAPLLWLGSVSYALYVSHQMIGYHLMAWMQGIGWPREVQIVLALGAMLAMADVLTRVIERPARRAILRRA